MICRSKRTSASSCGRSAAGQTGTRRSATWTSRHHGRLSLAKGPVSDTVGCAPRRAELHVETGVVNKERRPAMQEVIKVYVGLDVHKDSIAVGVADAGRTPGRVIG